MARKKSILTEQQAAYVEGVLDGKPKRVATLEAGYSAPNQAADIEKSEAVRTAIREARAELSSAAQIKRVDMIEVLIQAIDMSRMMADPMGMIAGAREVGKMLGLYAPEEKKIDLTVNQQRLRTQFEGMSDQELLDVIEGTSTRLDS
ncbi:MAG: hypothetical protein ACYCZR_03960 [Burkholderiales bacterium]